MPERCARPAARLFAMALVAALSLPATAPAGDGWRPPIRRAAAYAEGRSGSVAFAVVDEGGETYGYRARRTFPSASVVKAMFLVAYLRRAEVRDRRLRARDRSLLGPMIKRSDNDAASRVADIVGPRAMRRLARRAGMRRFRYTRPWGLSEISAGEQARFFFRIERYIPDRHEDYARFVLSHIVRSQRWGVAAYVDHHKPTWRIFFKGGWGSGTGWVDHQVALLESGRSRIALAVMTLDNPSHRYGKRTLRGVARRLLEEL